MRVTIKTLNQDTFKIEINDSDMVKNLKEKIQHDQGAQDYPVENQRLIYSGAILEDSKPLSHYKIDESKFVVLMVTKSTTDLSKQQQSTTTTDSRSTATTTSTNAAQLARPNSATQNANTGPVATVNPELSTDDTSALENFEQDLVSAMSSSIPDFTGNYPSMNELLQRALSETNTNLPFNIADLNFNDESNPFNDDGRGQLDQLKAAIESAGGLDAFISSAVVSADQPPSLLAAAMAVRDTSRHMRLSVDDTIAMLMSDPQNPFAFPLPELDELPNPDPSSVCPTENASQSGVANEGLVAQIVAMGFDRDSVIAALDLCMNNPESAIDYLTTGVPPGLISDMENFLLATPETLAQPRAAPETHPPNDDSSPFDYIRNHPELRETLTLVRENPDMMSLLLQRVAEENPELLQYISDHQEELIQFLNDLPPEITTDSDGNLSYSDASPLTSDEQVDVAQLMALGFSEMESIQAYLAFEKNVQMAAEFLLSDNSEE